MPQRGYLLRKQHNLLVQKADRFLTQSGYRRDTNSAFCDVLGLTENKAIIFGMALANR